MRLGLRWLSHHITDYLPPHKKRDHLCPIIVEKLAGTDDVIDVAQWVGSYFCFICFFVCMGLTSLLNILGHITTVPVCGSGNLTNVLPHRNAMLQTQDMTPYPDTVYRHRADLSLCYPPCLVGLVVSVSASHTVGHEFASRLDHTKDHHKNGTNCLPAWHAMR